MEYISVAEAAKRWEISERSVRNYCACGRIPGAVLNGKTWQIPEGTEKPARLNKKSRSLLEILQEEKSMGLFGGIYHKIQIELTYNSNHIEGSRLTHDQTRYAVFSLSFQYCYLKPHRITPRLAYIFSFQRI